MTQPTSPAGPFQMPTAAPAAAPAGRTVSSAGYWIGGAILIVGCGTAIVWFVVTIVGLIDAPNDFDRIAVPGSEVLTLDDGDWTIYYETNSGSGFSYGLPSVDVTGPGGRAISVEYSTDTFTYDINGNHGEALYEFRASTPGSYTVAASTVGEPGLRSGDRIAIGRPIFDGSRIGGILGSIAVGAISFLIGLVVLIVTIVRRGRAKRRPALAYGAPGPVGGTPYGAPPYPGAPSYPPTPGSWPPPQAPGWGAPPGGPPYGGQPPGAPQTWPPPAPGSSPWTSPVPSPSPDASPGPQPAPPSPWTPPGTPGGDAGSDGPDDDTQTS